MTYLVPVAVSKQRSTTALSRLCVQTKSSVIKIHCIGYSTYQQELSLSPNDKGVRDDEFTDSVASEGLY